MRWAQPGWVNVEEGLGPGHDFARGALGAYSDDSVEAIFTSHALEHVDFALAAAALKECHRILRPGAIMLIVVPDMARILTRFERGAVAEVKVREWVGFGKAGSLFCGGASHRSFYDVPTLSLLLYLAGFQRVTEVAYGESGCAELNEEATLTAGMPATGFLNPNTRHISLYLDAYARKEEEC